LQYNRDFWAENCALSGEEMSRKHGGDGGNWRRAIRAAREEFADLPWRADPRHKPGLSTIRALGDYDMLQPPATGPAILIYDIETAPGLAWVWSQWNTNAIAMEQDWYMLSFAYKWLNTDDIGFVSIFQDPSFAPDTSNDLFVAERLAALFDAADIVVAHNGDRFDRRKANQRFLLWDIDPPSPYQSVDTKKIAAREFSHFSNKLTELGRIHELGEKEHHTGFELWRECMSGNPAFWKQMESYNRQDVALLEKVYIKLLPWMGLPGKPGGINFGHWSEGGRFICPNCGHDHFERAGTHRSQFSEWPVFRCQRCRTLSRSRKRIPQHEGGVQLV
jgi:predicted RNA-binding Zn-ribbon protein involved in translation (DUF1610 family)